MQCLNPLSEGLYWQFIVDDVVSVFESLTSFNLSCDDCADSAFFSTISGKCARDLRFDRDVDDHYTVNEFRLTGFQKERRDEQAISASAVGDLLCQPPSDQWV